MTIYDYDNDFAHYETDEATQKSLGQIWTPFHIIEQMMDKAGSVKDKKSVWYDETKTNLDPTMGAGNIVIAMLYRRIVQCGQDPVVALSNVYGVELDSKTLKYARERIKRFMAHFTNENLTEIINHNFVCSDIFDWNIEEWRPYTETEKYAIEQKKKRDQEEQNAKIDSDQSFFS